MEPQTSTSTPRVNAQLIGSYINQKVAFVGRVANSGNGTVQVTSSDGRQVDVHLSNPLEQLVVGSIYEFQGRVNTDCSVSADNYILYNEKFDLNNYNEFVQLANTKFKHLFYSN